MTKLYEVLAVEPDLRQQANAELKRVIDLFNQGEGRLVGRVISYQGVTEDTPELPEEVTELATTVDSELGNLRLTFSKYLDATINKEVTNTTTLADVEEFDFLRGLPATALLNLENRLEEIKKAYLAIPTLDPSEKWTYSDVQGCFVSETRMNYRTKKAMKAFVSYEATEEHPAQVETYAEDVPTHKRETVVFSGALTVTEKRDRLERIEYLARAVKKARQRANDVETNPTKIAHQIFDYINQWE